MSWIEHGLEVTDQLVSSNDSLKWNLPYYNDETVVGSLQDVFGCLATLVDSLSGIGCTNDNRQFWQPTIYNKEPWRLTVAISRASTGELWGDAWIWPCGCRKGMVYLTWRRMTSRIEATSVALWVWMREDEKWSRIKNQCDIAAIFKRQSILRPRSRKLILFPQATVNTGGSR